MGCEFGKVVGKLMFRGFVKNVSVFLLFLFYCSCYWILPLSIAESFYL